MGTVEKVVMDEVNRFSSDSVLADLIKKQSSELEKLTPILFGASAFQYLNAGCEIGLFDILHHRPNLTKSELATVLELEDRAIDILLLGTTSLDLLEKNAEKYKNSPLIEKLFNDDIWQIFKDVVGFEQHIVYLGQVDFVESLRTNSNVGLRRVPGTGRDLYHRLNENPKLEKAFYAYMNSWTRLANTYLFNNVDFKTVDRVLDVGGGTGINAIALAKEYPHLKITVFEIQKTAEIARSNIDAAGVSDQVKVIGGDMFKDDFPTDHDCVLFSHQLVIWTPDENKKLLKKAYDVLPEGGKTIIFSSISDDNGSGPLMAALDSVYFAALPAEGGMIYCWSQYNSWLEAAGYKDISTINCHSWTPHGIVLANK
jgi:L-tyrosine C(3)-methyltransferase